MNFDVDNSSILSGDEKKIIYNKLKNRIDKNNILRVVSQSERSQYLNKLKALKRFHELIEKSLIPDKIRHETKPSGAEKEKRIGTKKKISLKKSLRKINLDKEIL